MTKWIALAAIINFALAATVGMAQEETVEEDLAPDISDVTIDREYKCSDRYEDEQEPYVFITTYFMPDEVLEESDAPEAASAFRLALVIISEAEFIGAAYQSGLDYRIDFTEDYNDVFDDAESTYALIIRANEVSHFYDMSGIKDDETRQPERILTCKRTT